MRVRFFLFSPSSFPSLSPVCSHRGCNLYNKQSTPDVAEPTQTGDGAAHAAVPDVPSERSTSSGPISSEADNTQAHETIPPNAATGPEARDTLEAPLTLPADSVSPPVPAKDASVNMPGPASQETSTPPAQTTDPAVSEAIDPEAGAKDPTAQSVADDSHATGEGPTAPQGEDAKPEKPPKLTLPMDRVRQFSAATEMSSSSAKTPADEAGSPAVEVEECGAGEPSTPGRPKKKKRSKKMMGEKNSPHSAPGAAVNGVDNPSGRTVN